MNAKFPLLFIVIVVALAFPISVSADGIIIPDPPPIMPPDELPLANLVIRYHDVEISIDNQVVTTHVDQVFFNPNSWTVEGTYIFPIPRDAAVTAFTLWIDGQPVEGEVLDADEARKIYEGIVREMRDPALLEYADQGAVRARIFPIQPGQERRIELTYTQALVSDHGLVRYTYPLNTEKFSTQPLERVNISVDLRSNDPVRAIYSPSHPVAINRIDEFHVTAGYEAQNVLPDSDFALYYSLGETEAFHMLSYRDPSDSANPDGFFMLLLAPRPYAETKVIPKDVILVLDRSGSMEGEKFLQAQEAAHYILDHLNADDRFSLISFSTDISTYASSPRSVEDVSLAKHWVDRLSAVGSTDINRALLEAAAVTNRERPTYLIFLTDGLPTEGVTESEQILRNFEFSAPENLRLFPFGVGYDVDTHLLDLLAQDHHGASTYVIPGERLDESLSAFYSTISTPVLTDLVLDFADLVTYDLYPSPLPDLFVGSQIVVVGRYRQGGTANVTLSGTVNGDLQTFHFDDQNFMSRNIKLDAQASIPRLWATRKIGYLLNQIRLQGPEEEYIDQIVRLSIRYGIVTPYTSYLVTEPVTLGFEEQERIAEDVFNTMKSAPAEPVSGRDAVEMAIEQGTMQESDVVISSSAEMANLVRIVGAHTFVFTDQVWMDTAWDPESMETTKVAFLSDDYFALVKARPLLGAAFALGERVIAISDGVAYEVISNQIEAAPIKIPEVDYPTQEDSSVADDQQDIPSESDRWSCLNALIPLMLIPLGLIGHRKIN
ncbi:MAG: VWA domain-containing protein [Anaerolineae bacterium]|nr:VWA domain-containing protein [Anaerolineae bacterium]